MNNAFNEKHPQDQNAWLDKVEHFVGDGADERDRAAEQRHTEIVGYLNLFTTAMAAGARAFADAIERGPRRR
jgi:hypothetical protein